MKTLEGEEIMFCHCCGLPKCYREEPDFDSGKDKREAYLEARVKHRSRTEPGDQELLGVSQTLDWLGAEINKIIEDR